MTGWILIAGTALAADCDVSTTRDDLEGALERASTAYEEADLKAFEVAVEDARQSIPCQGRPLTSSVAAQLHRIEALGAFIASDEDHAQKAFGAAKRLEPDFVFPDAWAPEGNPVRDLYDAGSPESPTEDAASPPTGTLRFDGRPTRARALEHPTLYQWVESSGDVNTSAYLWPSDPIPAYPLPVELPKTKKSARTPLLVGAGAGALASAGMLFGAMASRSAYDGMGTTPQNVDRRRGLTNGLVVGSGVTFGLGLGAGIAGIAVGK